MRRRNGATFFGVMVATVLISLAVIPIVTALINQTRQTKVNRNRIFATHLAHGVIERFRLEPFTQVKAALDTVEAGQLFIEQDPLLNPPDAPSDFKKMASKFKRLVVFSPVESRKGILEAFVTWSERGDTKQVRVATVLVDAHFPEGRPSQ